MTKQEKLEQDINSIMRVVLAMIIFLGLILTRDSILIEINKNRINALEKRIQQLESKE